MQSARAQLAQTKRTARIRRCVWASVTRRPRSSLYELAAYTGLPVSTVHDALYALRDAGYIDFCDGLKRARTVLVPFVMTKRKR